MRFLVSCKHSSIESIAFFLMSLTDDTALDTLRQWKGGRILPTISPTGTTIISPSIIRHIIPITTPSIRMQWKDSSPPPPAPLWSNEFSTKIYNKGKKFHLIGVSGQMQWVRNLCFFSFFCFVSYIPSTCYISSYRFIVPAAVSCIFLYISISTYSGSRCSVMYFSEGVRVACPSRVKQLLLWL